MVELLYVEDDEATRLYSQEFLARKGHIVHLAEDGLEGLDLLRKVDGIQIIFADFHMPRMNGLRFFEKVRNDPDYVKYSTTPVIGAGTFPAYSKNRLTECLEKPFESSELLRCIQQYCRK